MAIVTVGIDLAKNVFAVHGVDGAGRTALVRSSVARGKLLERIASLPPCLIRMEACLELLPDCPISCGTEPTHLPDDRTTTLAAKPPSCC